MKKKLKAPDIDAVIKLLGQVFDNYDVPPPIGMIALHRFYLGTLDTAGLPLSVLKAIQAEMNEIFDEIIKNALIQKGPNG